MTEERDFCLQSYSPRRFRRQYYAFLKLPFFSKKKSKKSSVSSSKDTKKTKQRVALGFLTLLTIILLILIGKGISIANTLFTSIDPSLRNERRYSWDSDFSLNIALRGTTGHGLLHFDPVEQKITILKIPDNTLISDVGSFGTWQLGSIFELGQAENPPIGAKLFKQAISREFALPVEGIMILDRDVEEESLKDLFAQMRGSKLSIVNFISKIKTDLTPVEIFKLSWMVSQLRGDMVEVIDLERSSITESKLLSDGSRVLGVNVGKFDLFLKEELKDAVFSDPDLTVAIFNATETVGLATKAARVITNMGGNVIQVTNSEELIDQSVILTKGSTKDKSYRRLAQLFAQSCLKQVCSSSDPKVGLSRAAITIILGRDYTRE